MSNKDPNKPYLDLSGELAKLGVRFQAGGDFGPVEDRQAWEKLMQSKTPERRELLQELTNFFDLLRYMEEKGQNVGDDVLGQFQLLRGRPVAERIACLRQINRSLMERCHPGNDSGFRQ